MSEVVRLGNIYNENAGAGFAGNVWDKNGICPTLTTMQRGGREPMIIEPKLIGGLGEKVSNGGTQYYNQDRVYDSDGVAVAVATSFQPNYLIVGMRGRNPDNPSDRTRGIDLEQRLEPNSEGICNTLTTVQKDNLVLENNTNYRIRKLTPRECWRLMGFTDTDFEAAEKVNSNTQLYKQAGNSIVKNVLMAIFNELINPSSMD